MKVRYYIKLLISCNVSIVEASFWNIANVFTITYIYNETLLQNIVWMAHWQRSFVYFTEFCLFHSSCSTSKLFKQNYSRIKYDNLGGSSYFVFYYICKYFKRFILQSEFL